MFGVSGRLKRQRTGKTKHRPLFVYHVPTLDAWIIEYREEHGIEPPPGTTKRRCLRCDDEFDSEGTHNRLCPTCAEYASSGGRRDDDDWIYCPDCDIS